MKAGRCDGQPIDRFKWSELDPDSISILSYMLVLVPSLHLLTIVIHTKSRKRQLAIRQVYTFICPRACSLSHSTSSFPYHADPLDLVHHECWPIVKQTLEYHVPQRTCNTALERSSKKMCQVSCRAPPKSSPLRAEKEEKIEWKRCHLRELKGCSQAIDIQVESTSRQPEKYCQDAEDNRVNKLWQKSCWHREENALHGIICQISGQDAVLSLMRHIRM